MQPPFRIIFLGLLRLHARPSLTLRRQPFILTYFPVAAPPRRLTPMKPERRSVPRLRANLKTYVESGSDRREVVMPEKYGKDVEGTEVNVEGNDWIFYLGEEPGQLRNLLSCLLS